METINALTHGLDLRRPEGVALLKERLDQAGEQLHRELSELELEVNDASGMTAKERIEFDRNVDIKRRRLEHFRNIWLVAKSNLEARARRTKPDRS